MRYLFTFIAAQLHKFFSIFIELDPIATMKYKHHKAVEQLKEARGGLEKNQAMVERSKREVSALQTLIQRTEAKIKQLLNIANETGAAKEALALVEFKKKLAEAQEQCTHHTTAYENNVKKVKHAREILDQFKDEIDEQEYSMY